MDILNLWHYLFVWLSFFPEVIFQFLRIPCFILCPSQVVRRRSKEEKFTVLFRHHRGHTCGEQYTVVSCVFWDAIEHKKASYLYHQLTDVLPKYGLPTSRQCEYNNRWIYASYMYISLVESPYVYCDKDLINTYVFMSVAMSVCWNCKLFYYQVKWYLSNQTTAVCRQHLFVESTNAWLLTALAERLINTPL